MSTDALLTLYGMAVVTFAIRAGGLLLANRLPTSGFVAVWLKHIPGAVLASLVAPAIVSGTLAEIVAAACATLAYLLTRNLFATMVAGVVAVYVARLLLGS